MIKSKKTVAIIAMVVMVLGLVAGCSSKTETAVPKVENVEITIAGSTSVQPISELLAENFMQNNPNIKVNVQGGGSGAGIKAAQTNAADVGASSRDLKTEEKGLVETVICKDGIAIVVNPQNPVKNLSLEQIRKIFTYEITNWSQVGGDDQEITVVTREEGSGTRGAFEELVMDEQPISDKAIVQNSTGAVRTTAAGDPNAIGFISLASMDETVKAVTVEGVQASVANIQNGTYKIQRPFLYLTTEEPSGAIKTYFDFVMSAEGQSLIESEGLISAK
ncbi:MAG: phosphate ABC transporter substrate-binding protein [Eubacteriales bacterium]